MEWVPAIGGFATAAGFAIVALVFVVRNKGLALDAKEADQARKVAEAALKVTSRDFDTYRDRAEAKEARLVIELERYENHELDGIEKEPDRAVRIKRRRRWVAGVLSQATNPTGDHGDPGVR